MLDALRSRLAAPILSYLDASPIARGKWRLAQIASFLCDGAPVSTTYGPRVLAEFTDSTFWLNARGRDEVKEMVSRAGVGDVLIDIGANIGMISLIAVERGALAIAVEASHREFVRLLANRALLEPGVQERLLPVQAAAGRTDGLAEFRVNDFAHSGGSSLGSARTSGEVSFVVPTVRIDSLVGLLPDGFKPAWEAAVRSQRVLVKIDVEGYERDVLEGMSGLLAARCCRVIVEMNVDRAERLGVGSDIVEFMSSFGYCPMLATGGRQHYDQLFIPEEDRE